MEELGCAVELVDKVFDDPAPLWMAEFYAGVGTRLREPMRNSRDLIDPAVVALLQPALDQRLEEYYARVFERYDFREKVRQFFERFDLLLTPATPTPAFDVTRDLPVEFEGSDIVSWVAYTYPFNLCGLPAASVPCGFTASGLPVGLMIAGFEVPDRGSVYVGGRAVAGSAIRGTLGRLVVTEVALAIILLTLAGTMVETFRRLRNQDLGFNPGGVLTLRFDMNADRYLSAEARQLVVSRVLERTRALPGAIAAGTSQYGMQSFDQSIFQLFKAGRVSYDEALRWASNVDEFKLKVQGISTTSDISRDQMAAAAVGRPPEITRFGG